jgi:chaperonin GroES
MRFKPMGDRVAIKRLKGEAATESGILLPDVEELDQGEVIASGPGRRGENGDLIANALYEGQRVVFGKYAGTTVKVDGEDILVMREEDVLGVIA